MSPSRRRPPDLEDDEAQGAPQRLDKWLVVARFARTRSLAQILIEGGHVRLDGKRVTDGARKLRAGDVLTLALPHATKVVRVKAGAEKRGSFAVARELYEEIGGG
ncbi:heat shock protein Hsp15 [Rhizobiales bacterium GAS191]|jgi:ribosome-associated heat shock protein Hsp15|nr:heat shock protein Hsp15 [Rhizobiales bacterium GAS113]SEC14091.1 heat shock protein Hsp15 [Rhizobiales bacterium GAS188]SED08789.1 heat shock protein Hsp15 [Rhizobiales bacterium GAS191]